MKLKLKTVQRNNDITFLFFHHNSINYLLPFQINSSCQIRSEINFNSDDDFKHTDRHNSTPSYLLSLVTFIQCSYFYSTIHSVLFIIVYFDRAISMYNTAESLLKRCCEYGFKWSMLHLASFKRLTCIT